MAGGALCCGRFKPVSYTHLSIAKITAGTLYSCHKAFYTPANMVLTVAGDVDPAQVCAIAREILPKEPGLPIDLSLIHI